MEWKFICEVESDGTVDYNKDTLVNFIKFEQAFRSIWNYTTNIHTNSLQALRKRQIDNLTKSIETYKSNIETLTKLIKELS